MLKATNVREKAECDAGWNTQKNKEWGVKSKWITWAIITIVYSLIIVTKQSHMSTMRSFVI